ncbi:hypothetical protein [Thermogutta sp.]|uniref:hypothetical protein n=1 Tax=Thermogutta sp. TaxID=1962930 RepID=UPI003220370B
MVRVTTTDLAEYLGSTDLPEDAERLLERATELVDSVISIRPAQIPDDLLALYVKAVCAQIEYWMHAGELNRVPRDITGYRIGSVSIDYTRGGPIAPRTQQYLESAGLLYAGANVV